jgi:hypothetical protein
MRIKCESGPLKKLTTADQATLMKRGPGVAATKQREPPTSWQHGVAPTSEERTSSLFDLGVEDPNVGLALLRVPLSTYTTGRQIGKKSLQSRKPRWSRVGVDIE